MTSTTKVCPQRDYKKMWLFYKCNIKEDFAHIFLFHTVKEELAKLQRQISKKAGSDVTSEQVLSLSDAHSRRSARYAGNKYF